MNKLDTDLYFKQRAKKETIIMIISVIFLVSGILLMVFTGFFEYQKTVAIALQVIGFVSLARWVIDGKEYVFPAKKLSGHDNPNKSSIAKSIDER